MDEGTSECRAGDRDDSITHLLRLVSFLGRVLVERADQLLEDLGAKGDAVADAATAVIRARRVEVVDAAGRVRAILDGAGDEPGLRLVDRHGHNLVQMGMNEVGAFFDFAANGNVMLAASVVEEPGEEPRASLHLCNPDGSSRVSLEDLADPWLGEVT